MVLNKRIVVSGDENVSEQLDDHYIVCILELYSVKINLFRFSIILFCIADALIAFILKFYPFSRVNFPCWEANLLSNRINLSRVNFKYVN